ncbi:hypothetical protein [Streptomyces flavalbus]|uniref:Large membrane protein n=1 Tax=Streptomyces flavalbus TaxID=2665155 RepID=A0ABW2W023_9ACTN
MTADNSPPPPDATSNATRLLCAGTYLDPLYRKAVIRELLTHRYRVVAPSYGYDAVPVLAHALAAAGLRRQQVLTLAGGAVLILTGSVTGLLDFLVASLLFGWLAWATMFLRRLAVLRMLTRHLAPPQDRPGFGAGYPRSRHLTSAIVRKISAEQNSDTVYYGGYKPFVGAGQLWRSWSNAELLIGVPEKPANPFGQALFEGGLPLPRQNGSADDASGGGEVRRRAIVPFTAADITDRVQQRMLKELKETPRPADRVQLLSVERRRFTKAERFLDTGEPEDFDGPDEHWREDYDAGREYLCVRIGAWQQELVTTVFVGFDIKGTTLHTEFYTYVLAPITQSFRLVDRLPERIDGALMCRIAWHVVRSAPGELLGLAFNPLKERLPRKVGSDTVKVEVAQPTDHSEFGLGRYAHQVVDCGARASVRELATPNVFHHFFQESDARKYTQIVERHLLQIIGDFLHDHDVDTREHEANQTNILQQNFGANSNNNFGGTQSVGNRGNQTFGNNSGITRERRPA